MLSDAPLKVQVLVRNLQFEIEKLKLENTNLKSAPHACAPAGIAPPALEAVVIPSGSEPVEAYTSAAEVRPDSSCSFLSVGSHDLKNCDFDFRFF